MKRFLRYIFLISCLFISGTWSISYLFKVYLFLPTTIDGNDATITINSGVFLIQYEDRFSFTDCRRPIEFKLRPTTSNDVQPWKFDTVNYAGFVIRRFADIHRTFVIVPLWLLFTPLFLLTLVAWYHPLRDRWRKNYQRGFAVEMKDAGKAPE